MSRVVLQKGYQKKFINRVTKYFGFNHYEIAKISHVSERTLRDWQKEKYKMSYESLLRLNRISKICVPRILEILPEYWSTKKAARLGAMRRYKIYGNPGTMEGRRLGGIISQQRFQLRQEYSGFKIRKEIKYPKKSPLLAEFIGIMLGDGGISEYQAHITFNRETDYEYANFIKKVIKELFSITASIVSGGKDDKGDDIVISSKNLVELLQRLGLALGNKIKNKADVPHWIITNKIYAVSCLRGLMDTDGSFYCYRHKVSNRIYYNSALCFTNHSEPLVRSVYKILKSLSFSPSRTTQRVYLYRKDDIDKYFLEVGSHNSKHLSKFNNYLKSLFVTF